MKIRRKSRELALQVLYFMDMRGGFSAHLVNTYRDHFKPSEQVIPYFEKLVHGVLTHRHVLDPLIERFSKNWKVNRMACVDRNILRIAAFEMVLCEDVPAKVVINEAVDIGKKFGTEDSGAFVNGILDSMRIAWESGQIQMTGQTDFKHITTPQGGIDEDQKNPTFGK